MITGPWHDVMPSTTYFSFVTPTSLGCGDMSPASPTAEVLAVLEAITAISTWPSSLPAWWGRCVQTVLTSIDQRSRTDPRVANARQVSALTSARPPPGS